MHWNLTFHRGIFLLKFTLAFVGYVVGRSFRHCLSASFYLSEIAVCIRVLVVLVCPSVGAVYWYSGGQCDDYFHFHAVMFIRKA